MDQNESTLPEEQAREAQQLLRESTRQTHPEIAALLDAGDVSGAAEAFLEVIA